MRAVRFGPPAAEPSIHNLRDAPSPSSMETEHISNQTGKQNYNPPPSTFSPKSVFQPRKSESPPPPVETCVVETVDVDDQEEQPKLTTTPLSDATSSPSSRPETPNSTGASEEETLHSDHDVEDYMYDEEEEDSPRRRNLSPISLSPSSFRYFLPKKRFNYDKLSSFVANHAPCFWCQRLEDATDRSILFRLNILCAFFALMQMGSAAFLLIVFFAPNITNRDTINGRDESSNATLAPNLWNVNGYMFLVGLLGLVIFVTMVTTLRFIKHITLLASIRYMWALVWILPAEIFMIISLFDYHRVTVVWLKHWWYVPTMAWFRNKFCSPGTSRTLCAVPVCGLPVFGRDTAMDGGGNVTCWQGEQNWCMAFHNATNCTAIRNEAQDEMETAAYLYYTLNAVWGLLLIVLLLLIIHRLERIVTKPVVQRSRESNIPAWLTLPIVGCAVTGTILLFSQTSVFSTDAKIKPFWIGIAYLASAALFFLAALLGWFISVFTILNNRDKNTKHAAVILFIITLAITFLAVAAIFAASIVYSINLVDFPLTDTQRGNIACFVDTVDSCSFCERNFPQFSRCPQWTTDDVIRVLRTQLKGSAVLAAIFLIYAFSALRFGFVLRKHVTQYQIDYV